MRDSAEMTLKTAERFGDVLRLDLNYPGVKPNFTTFQIRLQDVRAADDIRISYDLKRDGWKIEQEKINTVSGHFQGTGEWVEVAFVPAWGNETES